MLELAARAIHDVDQRRDPIVPDWEWVSQDAYMSMARAVLMAVRDLDREIVTEARKATVDAGGNMADFLGASEWQVSGSFARAIDAILAGDA